MNNRSIKKYRSEYDYPGLYRARVVDVDIEINDEGPNGYGAIKVFIPDVHTDVDENRNEFSDGIDAYPANSLTGAYNNEDELGETHYYQSSVYIPPKGSMVWVFFENGNVSKNCYYLTGFRCELAKLPPENIDGDEPHKITTVYKSNQGRAIVVSDDNRNSRVEITGKKRNLSNPPEGDKKSVYDIDGNQTTILLEEINGEEKLLIKSHRGDFINFNIERQELHIDFQGDIITKSSGDLFVDVQGNINYNTNQDFNIRTMGNFNLSSQGNMNINSASNFSINTQGLGTIDASLLMNQSKAGQGPPVIPSMKTPKGDRSSSFGSSSAGHNPPTGFNNVTHLDTITDQDKIEAERGSTLTEFLGNINPGNNINDFLSQVSDDQISEVDV